MRKLIRITTVPYSLGGLLTGQLRYMSQYYEMLGISSDADGHLKKVGDQEGIRVIPVEMTRKITLLKDLSAAWKLYRIFKREKPFIVHTHTPKAGTLGMLAAYLAGVPHRLHTIAGLPLMEATGFKRIVLDAVEKVTYACATKIYPNSFGLQQVIHENKYTSTKKLKVIGKGSSNGIDTSYFDPSLYNENEVNEFRNSLGIHKDDFVYIFVGRLVKDKGITELVGAFKELSKKYSHIKLLLVGMYEKDLDPLDDKTNKIIETNKAIITTGSQSEVRPYLALSDLLTFPSYREGFPNVVLEAGSMGLPGIVSDINGCNEIVANGQNGFIVPPKSESALRERMEELLLDKRKLQELAANARPMIRQRFERRFIWEELLKEYRTLDE